MLREDHPQFNHNGGDLAFGPDNMLYFSDGDGGGADDEGVGHQRGGNAQKLNAPLGKILRIDVGGSNSANGQYGIPADNPFVGGPPGTVKEIFAFGFWNPFRFSFDTATGRLFVGDVGQNDIEEVDVVVRGGKLRVGDEGRNPLLLQQRERCRLREPRRQRPRPRGRNRSDRAVRHAPRRSFGDRGFVYHGASFPQLQGRYVFGDFARLFRFPAGPNDSGRLFWLTQKEPKSGLSPRAARLRARCRGRALRARKHQRHAVRADGRVLRLAPLA